LRNASMVTDRKSIFVFRNEAIPFGND